MARLDWLGDAKQLARHPLSWGGGSPTAARLCERPNDHELDENLTLLVWRDVIRTNSAERTTALVSEFKYTLLQDAAVKSTSFSVRRRSP